MILINLNEIPFSYDSQSMTFVISEKDVAFATEYELLTPKGSENKKFAFTHSTGPEFDAKTRWVYKSSDNYTLEVCNDAKMVERAAAAYLAAKLKN